MAPFNPHRVTWNQAYRTRTIRSRIKHFLCHEQAILTYVQACICVVSIVLALTLSAHGFDTLTLLIIQKLETLVLNTPMHIVTLTLAKRASN